MSDTAPEIRSLRNGATTVTYAVTGPTHSQARTICLIASTGRGPEDFFHLGQPGGYGPSCHGHAEWGAARGRSTR